MIKFLLIFFAGLVLLALIPTQYIPSFLAGLHTEADKVKYHPYYTTPVIDNKSSDLMPLTSRAGETIDFPVYLDVNDPFYPQRLRSWMIQHVKSRDYETFVGRKEEYRRDTEKRHIENGINIQDIIDRHQYENDQDRRRRAIERIKALENFGRYR
jgi:hypothetical protein